MHVEHQLPNSILRISKGQNIKKHQTIQFIQIITKTKCFRVLQFTQENKLAIIINLRSYNLLVTHCHSFNRRERENPLPLSSKKKFLNKELEDNLLVNPKNT
ncbi:hypothetical protein AAZX31_14G125000 [Glycine max]